MTERNEPMTEARLAVIEEDARHFGGSIAWRIKELIAEIRRLKQVERERDAYKDALKMITEVFYADPEKTAERMLEIAENTIEEWEETGQ